ncbi:MAG: isoprenylcysteine carboxylmethyltransferase family protein [Eubacterium sp.]|nr:isoprenylcysteine carboxylmethyltransferase family protein [Eubacterium sp.]
MGNTLKNYSKEGQKLPMFGIGPYLIYGVAFLNAVVIVLTSYVFKVGILEDIWVWIFRIVGGIVIILGIVIWFIGAMRSGMDENITENKLKTDGIYSWVRNPMYTGCWFIMIGISFMWHNYWMLPMILIDWVIFSIVLKNTEEKWLLDVYGQDYEDYKKRVNRCIPWIPKE